MALPINIPEFVDSEKVSLQVALFTIISLLLSFFILPENSEDNTQESEEHKEEVTETPQKRPRTLQTPSAPKKKPRTCKPSSKLTPKALFKDEQKTETSPSTIPKIKDIRTFPSVQHTLSFGTHINSKLTLSAIKSETQAIEILDRLSTLYDFTAPISLRRALVLTNTCIEQHVMSLIEIKSALTFLNRAHCALPHNGSGTLTSYKDGTDYLLTDKAFNAICHISQVNHNLSKALNKVFSTNKTQWTIVPKTFENACSLAREAHILSRHISRLHNVNTNMTSWAEW